MKTFDYQQVQAVLSPIKAKFDDCAHGEGNACEIVDTHLDCCAQICLEMHQAVVNWANDVFAGRVVFDPEAEQLWKAELTHVYARARGVWQMGRRAEVPCWELKGQSRLEAALWHLNYLLQNWVTPKPSVGPSPRAAGRIDDATLAAMRQRLASLPKTTPPGQGRAAG